MNIQGINNVYIQTGEYIREQAPGEGFRAALENAVRQKDEARLHKACEDFESYFLQIMFREMRKSSLRAGGIFAKSNSEEIFEDMLYEEYSKTAASKGGVGLADMMYRQLSNNIR